MDQPPRNGLARGIRRWDLLAVAINGIIGAGIFGLPSKTYSLVGSYSLFAFLVAGFIVTIFTLCFAEVGSRFNETGGPYLYVREAFGPVAGFEVGWLVWLARLTGFAANCNLLVSYLAFFWPGASTGPGRGAIIMLVTTLLATINLVGVRYTALASDVFTIAKLIPLLTFIAAGLFFLQPQRYSLAAPPGYGIFSTSILLLIYAFGGFEMAGIPAGETRHPREDLPRAILTAIAVVIVAYVLIQVVCIGTLPGLATSERPLADASQRFLGRGGAALISAGAIVSIAGNLGIIMLAGSRMPFAMAERGELPRVLATIHRRFRTPHFSILLTAAVMLTMTLTGSFITALTVSAIARLVAYGATCAALLALRHNPNVPEAMFRAPAGAAASIVGVGLAAWLLFNVPGREALNAGVAGTVGLLIYLTCSRWQRSVPAEKSR
jgi:basic amino acid/polyamine antiporter, APA family